MRHFYVDRIIELERGVRAVGVKSVSLSEDFLHDHFPGNPVYPGVFLVEGLAQTGGVLLHDMGAERFAVMVSIDRARFTAFARPGDMVRLEVEVEAVTGDSARVRGTASVGEREVAAARLTYGLFPLDTIIAPAYRFAWQQTLSTWLGRYPEPPRG